MTAATVKALSLGAGFDRSLPEKVDRVSLMAQYLDAVQIAAATRTHCAPLPAMRRIGDRRADRLLTAAEGLRALLREGADDFAVARQSDVVAIASFNCKALLALEPRDLVLEASRRYREKHGIEARFDENGRLLYLVEGEPEPEEDWGSTEDQDSDDDQKD